MTRPAVFALTVGVVTLGCVLTSTVPRTPAFAETATVQGAAAPWVLPTSPWYWLKRGWEKVENALARSSVAQAELRLERSNERLAEVKELFAQPADEKSQAAIAATIAAYQRESESLERLVRSLGDQLAQSPRLQAILRRDVQDEFARQELLRQFAQQENLQAAVEDKIGQALEQSTESTTAVLGALQAVSGAPAVDSLTATDPLTQLKTLQTVESLLAVATPASRDWLESFEQGLLERIDNTIIALDEPHRQALWEEFLASKPTTAVIAKVQGLRQAGRDFNIFLQSRQRTNQPLEFKEQSAADALRDTGKLFERPE